MNETEAKNELSKYLELKAQKDELEKQMDVHKNHLKTYLEQKNLKEFATDAGVVLIHVVEQKRLNKAKLKSILAPRDWDFVHEKSSYNRMQIYSTESFEKRNEGLKKGQSSN